MDQMKDNREEDFSKRYKARIHVVEDGSIPTYADDPFFKKKLEEANKAFDNAPLPEHIAKLIIKD